MIDFKEAKKLISEQSLALNTQTISLSSAFGYYLAEDILADRNYPPFNRAAMDGYAVNSTWYNALDKKAMVSQGACFAGNAFEKHIDSSKTLKIMTGAAVPPGLDAIVKIEECHPSCDLITFEPNHLNAWCNIAQEGEDIKKNSIILTKGTLLNNVHLQVLATVGQSSVKVFLKPKIGLITTGNEVRSLEEKVNDFQIRNSNKWSLLASAQQLGQVIHFSSHVGDDKENTKKALIEALKTCDIILFTGGVSMGDADYIPLVLKENNISNIFHKVAIKPGKPIWFGTNKKQVVFGLPGNPLSAFQDFHLFVKPFLSQINSNSNDYLKKGILESNIKAGRIDRFLPFIWKNGSLKIKQFNGSGDITSLIGTAGMIFIPKNRSYVSGDIVEYLDY